MDVPPVDELALRIRQRDVFWLRDGLTGESGCLFQKISKTMSAGACNMNMH
jgi:hypothetical protein